MLSLFGCRDGSSGVIWLNGYRLCSEYRIRRLPTKNEIKRGNNGVVIIIFLRVIFRYKLQICLKSMRRYDSSTKLVL